MTPESNQSNSITKIGLAKLNTSKKNSLKPYYLTKLNAKMNLDTPTTLLPNQKKKKSLDIKNMNTIPKLPPKYNNANNNKTLPNKNNLIPKQNNYHNVTLNRTEAHQKLPAINKFKLKQGRSDSNNTNFDEPNNDSAHIKESKIGNIISDMKKVEIFNYSHGFSSFNRDNYRNIHDCVLTSFNKDYNLKNSLAYSPEKFRRDVIDQDLLTYPNKNIFDLIMKIKILLDEGNREGYSLFPTERRFNGANLKEELDRELKRNMFYFEIDNLTAEAGELCNKIKHENKAIHDGNNLKNNISSNSVLSQELTNINNSSERRISIYKNILQISGDAMNEIKQALTNPQETKNFTENKHIIINNENNKIENNTNNITNTVFNNSNHKSSNNLKLNLNLNIQTINQFPKKSEREINQHIIRKSFKRKSRNTKCKTTGNIYNKKQDIESDDCDDESMISEGVDVKLPQRIFTVKKPQDTKLNYIVYTEANVNEEISPSLESNLINYMTDSSGNDNTLNMYKDRRLNMRNKKLRSKSVLQIDNRYDIYNDRKITKTKKLTEFPFIENFRFISISNVILYHLKILDKKTIDRVLR